MRPSRTYWDLLADESLQQKAILEKLLRHRCGLTKEQLFANTEHSLEKNDEQWIRRAYKAHVKDHQPLEYILGYVSFLGKDFIVTKDTLIPRPETEYMINAIREWYHENLDNKAGKSTDITLFDIGTGCGVLGLSVLWHVGVEAFKHAFLTDISDEALEVAKQNWEELFIKENKNTTDFQPTFLKADLLQHAQLAKARKNASQNNEKLLLIGNLPYIPEKLFEDNTDQSVKKREPKFAFVGGDDGLDRYRKMFDQLIALQEENPVDCTQFLEMMTWQVDILRNEYGEYFVFEEVKTFHFNIKIVKTTRK